MILKYLLLIITVLSINAYAIVGATKGSADVAQGNFTYDLEIITPKGVSGLKPSLGINYNSANSINSIMGEGFSIAGLSTIAKCSESLFSEKQDTSRDHNFCLDGQKLLLVDEAQVYGATNTEYKTEINNQSKIIKLQNSWIVHSKDGLIHEYGATTDSNDGDIYFKVNKITDRYSNDINFIYATNNNHRYISQITYSNNTIDFIYEARTDTKIIYSRGLAANIDQRLKTISLKTANQELSSYNITYEYNNGVSRITNIQECVNGECLEPLEFTWEQNNDVSFGDFNLWLPNGVGAHSYNYVTGSDTSGVYSALIDMNGDGLPDRVSHKNYATGILGIHVALNTGNGFGDYTLWLPNGVGAYPNNYITGSDSSGIYSALMDMNGDGLPDRVGVENYVTGVAGLHVALNTGSGFGDYTLWLPNGVGAHTYNYVTGSDTSGVYSALIDMNGDGLPDRVSHKNYATGVAGLHVALNQTKKSKIISVSNSKDQDLQIEYSDLRDSSVYTSLNNSSYPEIDIKASPMSVVKSFKVADAVGGVNTTTFKYEGFKVHRERGSLGFAKIETSNDISNTKTITNFHQTFPYIGVSKSGESYLDGIKIADDTNIIIATSYFTSNPNILNLESTHSSQNKYDTDGTYILTHETTNSLFDKYGNIANIQTLTKNATQEYSKITQSVYTNDETNWILSRLTNAQVTHIHADASTIVKTSSFIYDSTTGTLISEVIEPGSTKQLAKSYTYSPKGNKILETLSGTDILPRATKYLYDAEGKNIIKVENALGHVETREYDINNQLTKVTGPNGLSTTFLYDAMGKKIQEIRADGTTSTWTHAWDETIQNSMYKVTQTTTGSPEVVVYFNKAGKKLKTVKIGFDGSKIYENTVYDGLGRVTSSSTPYYDIDAPAYINNTYDSLGRIISTDRPGANGGRIQDSFIYDALDVIYTNAKGQIKTTKSNIIGKKVQIIEGDSIINYKYDAFGNLTTTTDSKGNVISLTYDLFGNKTGMDDPDMGMWSYSYNALGLLLSQTDAKGQVSTMSYDLLGRMISRVETEGETTWTYDRSSTGIGKLSFVQNADYRKELYYDTLGRLQSIKEFIDGNVFRTSYEYNTDGKLEKTISPDGFTSVNEYNTLGFLQAVKSPKFTNNLYTYDEIKIAIQDSLNLSMQFAQEAVDYSNQAEKQKAKGDLFATLAASVTDESLKAQLNSTAALSLQTSFLLKTSSDDSQEESLKALGVVNYFLKMARGFEDANFYEYVADKFRDQTRFYIDMALVNLNNAIDSVDNLLANSTLDEAYRQQEEDMINSHIAQAQSLIVAAQGLSQKVLNYKTKHVDAVALAQTQTSTAYLDLLDDENYNYYYKVLKADEFGRVISDIVGNGLITKKEYNKVNGHLNYITTGYNGDNDVRDIVYTFDEMDNVLSKIDSKQNITENYTYDSINRLSSANIVGNSFSTDILYTYDNIGNIVSKSDVGTYGYQRAHQVVAAGNNTYTYDENGNVIQKNNTTLTYSSYNKPVKIEDATNTTEFFYAPNRARYKKTLNGDTTYYAGKLFEKEVADGKVLYKNFVYAGGELIAINIDEDDGTLLIPSVRYLHKDALGSIDTVTNESGEVIQRLAYKPFGERIVGDWINQVSESQAITKRGYTGHEHISEFNLIHMNGRVYDPTIGRFLSADPYIQAPYDTQSYNRYSYVKNNPLKYTDPSGFFFKKLFKKIGKVFKKVVNFVKKYIKVILVVVIVAVVSFYTGGLASGWVATWGSTFFTAATATTTASLTIAGSMAVGAIAGAAAGFVGGALMTGTLSGALKGAAFGAIGGAVAGGIGAKLGHDSSFFESIKSGKDWGVAAGKAVVHGVSRAVITSVQGGKASAGFFSGFISSGFAAPKSMGFIGGTAATAVLAGTTSEISGGKFANGAVTGAFVHMFNASFEDNLARGVAFGNDSDKLDVIIYNNITKFLNKTAGGAMLKGAWQGYKAGKRIGSFPGAIVGPGFGMIYKVKIFSDKSKLETEVNKQ